MAYKTIIDYVDIETGEIILISPWELDKWEVKTINKTTIQNGKDYEIRITKSVRPTRQQKLPFSME